MSCYGKILFFIAFAVFISCSKEDDSRLMIASHSDGFYEIYSVVEGETIQFTSKQLGRFNEELFLSAGKYLILADCSHEIIDLKKNDSKELLVHTIDFIRPSEVLAGDIFSIQCSRFEQTLSPQVILNRFRLNVLNGKRDILVGMKPLTIPDFNSDTPQMKAFMLSSLQVLPDPIISCEKSPYFVSLADDVMGITQPQNFGNQQFLLPGNYIITLNGTTKNVELKENESTNIIPGYINIKKPLTPLSKQAPDKLLSFQKQNFFYSVNQAQNFLFDKIYPLLDGTQKIKFEGSLQTLNVEIQSGKQDDLLAKALLVDTGCSVYEWECLGKKQVTLYEKNQPYIQAEAKADAPIFFYGDHFSVGVEGSYGIKYLLSADKFIHEIKTGVVTFVPKLIYKYGHLTDLVRLESIKEPHLGYSNDIPWEHEVSMTLFEGSYTLSRYTSINDIDRQVVKKHIVVVPKENLRVEIPFYVPESKVDIAKNKLLDKKEMDETSISRSESKKNYLY